MEITIVDALHGHSLASPAPGGAEGSPALAKTPTPASHQRPDEPACPLCRRIATRRIQAALSPFLIFRCELDPRTAAFTHLCTDCEHVFFTPFLSECALDRLYEEYRSVKYTEQRLIFEPDYRAAACEFADKESNYHQVRCEFYDEVLYDIFDHEGVVTDFGGGDGFFSRYVFPRADVVLLERDYEACGINAPELLNATSFFFCSYVLQTSPDPLGLLRSCMQHLRARTPVWIELPKQYAGSLEASFAVEEARSRRNAPAGPLRLMHENLNHFSLKSARKMVEFSGIEIETVIRTNMGITAFLGHRKDNLQS